MKRLPSLLGALAASAALAACSNSSTNNPNPTPTTCPLPAGISNPFLVYPAANSSSLGPNIMQIVVATQGGSLVSGGTSNWDVVIVDALNPAGAAGTTFTTTAPPFPSPYQPPSYANPSYQMSGFAGGFASGQTVGVFLNNVGSVCTPISLGSFTTT